MLFKNASELIGNTPLVELTNIEKQYSLKAKLYAKVEYFNPTGSVKDRIALSMINDALEKGLINENSVLIEPTSGNTGIGIAALCAMKNIKCILVMPESMSIERRKLLSIYGAKLVLTEAKEGMGGSIKKAKELEKTIPNAIILGQFDNEANPRIHYLTTGKEIYNDLNGKVDLFIAGIGTGGTISGTGKYLKEKIKDIKIIGVEPLSSPVISQNKKGSHKIQGIGAGFIPSTLDLSIIDKVETCSDEDAFEFARIVPSIEGMLVGISSGASLKVAIEYAKKEENTNKNIVVLFPDSGDRYLSTDLFNLENN
ncbi:MAG: cysteine synthase A [Candidatus Onthovivens sp.]|nr:cysteine synthase A [Candidatus Onthovivens sp.]